jgi:hypothetical protein
MSQSIIRVKGNDNKVVSISTNALSLSNVFRRMNTRNNV